VRETGSGDNGVKGVESERLKAFDYRDFGGRYQCVSTCAMLRCDVVSCSSQLLQCVAMVVSSR